MGLYVLLTVEEGVCMKEGSVILSTSNLSFGLLTCVMASILFISVKTTLRITFIDNLWIWREV